MHGDGAGALVMTARVAHVGPGRPHDAHKVEAAVLEEALVFGRHDGVYQGGRQVLVEHRAALFARAVEEISNQLRLDFCAAHIRAAG